MTYSQIFAAACISAAVSAASAGSRLNALEQAAGAFDSRVGTVETALDGVIDTELPAIRLLITNLTARVAQNESDKAALRSELDTAKAALIVAEGAIDDLEADLIITNGNIALNDGDILTLDGRLDTAEPKIVSLENRMLAAESDIDDAEADIIAAVARIAVNESDIDTAEGKIMTLEGKVMTAESEIDDLQSRLMAEEGKVVILQGQIITANNNITNLTGRVATEEGNVDTLQSELNTAEGEIDDLQTDLGTAEGEIDALQALINNLIVSYDFFDVSSADIDLTINDEISLYGPFCVSSGQTIEMATQVTVTDNLQNVELMWKVDGTVVAMSKQDSSQDEGSMSLLHKMTVSGDADVELLAIKRRSGGGGGTKIPTGGLQFNLKLWDTGYTLTNTAPSATCPV